MRRGWSLGRATGGALGLVALAGMAGCASDGRSAALGQWVGTMRTVSGTCPDGQPSDLVVSERLITFVPGDGVLALTGKPGPDPDRLHAQLLGTDMNHKPLPMVFEGTLSGGVVSGEYGTPTCRARITLHRPTRTGLQRLLGH